MANLNCNPFSFMRWTHLKKTMFESAKEYLALTVLLATVISSQAAIAFSETPVPKNPFHQAVPQQSSPPQAGPPQSQPANSVFMLPPGTKLPLGLLRPLRVKPGQDV